MFYSRTSKNKLNNIHEKCLRFITNDFDSNFNKLLESSHELSIHKTYINYLMIEFYKYFYMGYPLNWWLAFLLFWKILAIFKIFVIWLCQSVLLHPRSVCFGVDAVAFHATQLWQKVPIGIKEFSSLEIFKAKIKLWSCHDCPYNPCKDLSPM